MTLESLIDRSFYERELFDLIVFDVEENLEKYYGQIFLIYFDRVAEGRIRVSELQYFKDEAEQNKLMRQMIEKKEWFDGHYRKQTFNVSLCRFDRSGYLAYFCPGEPTHHQECRLSWAGENPNQKPMTEEEIRQAFRELMGILDDQTEFQKSKTLRAV